ncbi:GGDEF domain-containing protein [Pleionea sediminis]|uniref:GGDEF domain-containing protein n=1 Tax=Pleionea sediminis TaxID=2569479 RepID=UPI001184AE77|nr:GGDEF domain-containing protein [Pleionea sediminis]
MKFLSILAVLLYSATLFSSENSRTTPIILDNDTILIDHLPSNTSRFWRMCDSHVHNAVALQFMCDPIKSAQSTPSKTERTHIFQLSFILDETLKNSYPGLLIEEIPGADELYLNGELVATTGNFPPRFENAAFYSRYYYLPPEMLQYNKPNTLQLHIYSPGKKTNMEYMSTIFYPYSTIEIKAQTKDLLFSFITAVFFMIFIVKLHYFIRIPASLDALALSAFSLLAASFVFLNHHIILAQGFDANSVLRWKTVAFIFAQLALNAYLFQAYGLKKHQFNRIVASFYLLFGISVLIWPSIDNLQDFFNWAKVTAFVSPIVIMILSMFHKRESNNQLQIVLSSALGIYLVLLAFDITRYSWLTIIDYRENSALIYALLSLALASSFVSTEKYWQFFKGATYDHLTGTLLKPSFLRRLSEEMQRCRRSEFCLLVAVIDIDQFRMINQNYGHEVGDKTLVIISATLTRALRQFDLICRLNDDEFCVAVTLPNGENTRAFLQRLHDEINNASVTLDNNEKLNLKATTGAVIYNAERHEAPEMLLLDAEHSVTEAKMRQRGSIHWFDTENPPLQFIF